MESENCSYDLRPDSNSTSDSYFTELAVLIYNFHNHVLLVLPIINIILNGFCLFIFFDKIWKKSILSVLLKYLSATEIAFNFSGFLYIITKFIDYPSVGYFSKLFWVFILQFGTFTVATSLICRNWTILHLAAYRFESICRPLSATKIYSNRSTYKFLWLTYFLAAIIALPRTFEYEATFCQGNLLLKPGLIKYHWYTYGYQGSLIFIIQTGCPVVITSILSIAVMRAIIKMKKFRKNRSKKLQTKKTSVSGDILMIFICFAFFVLEIPSFFSKVLSKYLIKNDQHIEDILLATIANLLVYLDSVINIFVYIISNPTFREKSKDLLQIKCQQKIEVVTEMTALEKKDNQSDNEID